MRSKRCAFFAMCLWVAATAARADESAAAREIIEKAIVAHGGEATLAKCPVVTMKFKGTVHGSDKTPTILFKAEMTTNGAERVKLIVESENFGKFRLVSVLNGDRGWIECNGDTQEVKKEKLATMQEDAYSAWVASLLPLKDEVFNVTTAGEVTIDDRPALGVQVSRKGHRDVKLFFDKETRLLVKTERLAKDDRGLEVTEETFLSDYKEAQDIKQAMKITLRRGGKPYQTWEVTEYQLAAKAIDGTFDKP
jgi:hypothetical protein